MELKILIEKFCYYLHANNYSKTSIQSYQGALEFYLKFLKNKKLSKRKYFLSKTAVKFKKYLLVYKKKNGKKLSNETSSTYFSKVKVFHDYLMRESYILINPYKLLETIKTSKQLIKKSIPVDDIERIMSIPDLNTARGFRDRAILEALYSTGIRRAEISGLKVYDVDVNDGFIQVTGKGNKTRIVPIGKRAIELVRKYITEIRPQLIKNYSDESLFIGQLGKGLKPPTINVIVKKYIKEANVNIKHSCHSFRHTCGVEMLKGKASIRHVQEMLGHENIGTTQKYTKLMPIDLKKTHKETHPSNWIFSKIDQQ